MVFHPGFACAFHFHEQDSDVHDTAPLRINVSTQGRTDYPAVQTSFFEGLFEPCVIQALIAIDESLRKDPSLVVVRRNQAKRSVFAHLAERNDARLRDYGRRLRATSALPHQSRGWFLARASIHGFYQAGQDRVSSALPVELHPGKREFIPTDHLLPFLAAVDMSNPD